MAVSMSNEENMLDFFFSVKVILIKAYFRKPMEIWNHSINPEDDRGT